MRRIQFFLPKIVLGGVFTIALFAPSARAELYAPGETLDPSCAPTDVDCGVQAPIETGTAGQFPYYSADGSVASATSTITLLSSGYFGVGTSSPYAQLSVGGNVVIGAKIAGGTLGDLFLPKLGTPAGKFLAVDPTGKIIATSSPSGSGSGTVTSVGISVPSFLSVAGSPVTTAGTIDLSYSGTALPLANGGTGLTSYTGNRILYTNAAGTALLQTSTSTLNIGGNAATATALQTARTINGVSFNGTANIMVNAASSTLLSDRNTFTQLQLFNGHASTTQFTVTGNSYLSTIKTGTWNGSTLTVAFGGTGSTTLSGVLKGNGTGGVLSAIPGVDYQRPITLTTTGSSGAATFTNGVLNIPQYSGGGGSSASSTLLSDNNTFSGSNTFTSPIHIGSGSGTTTVNGNIGITGNIVPSADNTYGLGDPTHQWRDAYIGPGSLYVNGKKVLEDISNTITFSTDVGQNLSIKTSGIGSIDTNATGSGNVNLTTATGNINFTTSSGNINFTPGGNLNLGTIASGLWHGTAIGATYGGTGSTTLTGILKGNGTSGVLTAVAGTDYQRPITLTTTGSSGAATFVNGVLNIPQYSGGSGSSASSTLLADNNTFSGNNIFSTLPSLPLTAGYILRGSTSNIGQATSSIFVANSGLIGIGTTSPRTRTQIYGTLTVDPAGQSLNSYSEGIRIGNASDGYSIVTFGANTGVASGVQTNQWYVGKDGTDNGFTVADGATKMLHILTTGSVGIGSLTPYSSVLRVDKATSGGIGGSLFLTNSATAAVGNKTALGFDLVGFDDANTTAKIEAALTATNGATDLIFDTYDGSGGIANHYESMRIKSNGLVGIGTASPSALLHVRGSSTAGIEIYADNQGTGTASYSAYRLRNADAANTENFLSLAGSSYTTNGVYTANSVNLSAQKGPLNLITQTSVPIIFITGGHAAANERMRLDASGNLGIGTTSPGTLLSLGDTGANTISISVTATSTFGHGLNLKAGCYALNSTCLSLSNLSGLVPVARGGTGSTTLTGILKGNGTSGVATAIAGTDYQIPITLTTSGSSGAATFSNGTLNIPQYSGGGGGSASAGPSFYAYNTAGGTATGGGVFTKIALGAEAFDTNNNFDTSNSRFQPTVAGKYILTGSAYVSAIASGKSILVAVYKNGVLYSAGNFFSSNVAGPQVSQVSTIVDANGTSDYFELYVYLNDPTNRTVGNFQEYTYFSGSLLAPVSSDITNNGSLSYLTDTGDNFGIGTTSPSAKLNVYGNELLEGTDRYLNFGTTTGSTGYGFRDNAGVLEFKNRNGVWNGVSTATTGPSFMVNKNGTNQTVTSGVTTKLTWATKVFDTNNNFDLVNNRFTPTVPGKYLVTVAARCTNTSSYCVPAVFKNGAMYFWVPINGSGGSGIVTTLVNMNGTTDYLEAEIYAVGTTISGLTNETQFSGTLIAPVSATAGGITNNGTASYLADNTDKFGIGTSSPFAKLAVQGTSGQTNPLFEIASSSQATKFLTVKGSNGYVGIATSSPYKTLSVGGDVFIGASSAGGTRGDLYISKLAAPAGAFLAIDPSGKVIATTTPSGGGGGGSATAGPSFYADKNGTNQTVTANAATLLTLSNETFDTNNNFDTGTGRFQPTVPGKYLISGTVGVSTSASGQYVLSMIYKNGSIVTRNTSWSSSGSQTLQANVSAIVSLNGTTDYVELYGQTSLTSINGTSYLTNFSGSLIAPIDAGGISNNGTASYLTDTADNFGIGTTSPSAKPNVYGNALLEGTNRYLNFGTSTGASGYGFRDNAGVLEFKNRNGVWSGVTTATTGPSFLVDRNGTNQTVTSGVLTVVDWTNKEFDTNNNFDLTNDRFQPTVPGKYLITAAGRGGGGSASSIGIRKNGVVLATQNNQGGSTSMLASLIIDMNGTTDYVDLTATITGNTSVLGASSQTYFMGTMIAPVSATGGGVSNNGTASYLADNTDKFGIGTSSPFAKLAVQGTSGQTNPLFEIASSSQSTKFLTVKGSSGFVGIATSSPYKTLSIGGDVFIGASSAGGTGGDLYIQKLGIPAGSFLAVNPQGKIIATTTPSGSGGGSATAGPTFSVDKGGTNQTVTANITTLLTWSNENFDTNNNFDTGTGRFQPTVAGKYLINSNVGITSTGSGNFIISYIYKNGSAIARALYTATASGQTIEADNSIIVDMNGTTDYIEFYGLTNLTTIQGGATLTSASGALLAPLSASGITNNGSVSYLTDTGDNFGVGTTSPWRKFSVTGTVGLDGLTAASGAGSICLSSNKELVYNSGSDSCLPSLRATKHDITNLSLSATSTIEALNPVSFIYNNDTSSTTRYGFIAEDTADIDPHLATYDAAGNLSGIDDRAMLAVVVKALKDILSTLGTYAQSMTTAVLNATTGNFTHVKTQDICVGSTCITETELKAILEKNGQSSSTIVNDAAQPPPESASSTEPVASSTPPVVSTSTAPIATSTPTTEEPAATTSPIIIEDVPTSNPDIPPLETENASISTPEVTPPSETPEDSPQEVDTASTTAQ